MNIEHLTTNIELVHPYHGDTVAPDAELMVFASTLRHPETDEHLISIVPTSHEQRQAGFKRYRVIRVVDRAILGYFNSLQAAQYFALSHVIEREENA